MVNADIWSAIGRMSTDSSIGDLVTHSLRHLLILEHKELPLKAVTLRHFISVMRKHDLTNILTALTILIIVDSFF